MGVRGVMVPKKRRAEPKNPICGKPPPNLNPISPGGKEKYGGTEIDHPAARATEQMRPATLDPNLVDTPQEREKENSIKKKRRNPINFLFFFFKLHHRLNHSLATSKPRFRPLSPSRLRVRARETCPSAFADECKLSSLSTLTLRRVPTATTSGAGWAAAWWPG